MGEQGFDELAALTERPPLPDEQLTEKDRLIRRIAELESTVVQLREALEECTRLSGADLSDGFPGWPPLHEFAVQEVKELRDRYDEACAESFRSLAQTPDDGGTQ